MDRRRLMALTAAALTDPQVLSTQESWLDRPVHVIMPYPLVGSTDTIARSFQAELPSDLGESVAIENWRGVSGSIGAIEVARPQPDGMTADG